MDRKLSIPVLFGISTGRVELVEANVSISPKKFIEIAKQRFNVKDDRVHEEEHDKLPENSSKIIVQSSSHLGSIHEKKQAESQTNNSTSKSSSNSSSSASTSNPLSYSDFPLGASSITSPSLFPAEISHKKKIPSIVWGLRTVNDGKWIDHRERMGEVNLYYLVSKNRKKNREKRNC